MLPLMPYGMPFARYTEESSPMVDKPFIFTACCPIVITIGDMSGGDSVGKYRACKKRDDLVRLN